MWLSRYFDWVNWFLQTEARARVPEPGDVEGARRFLAAYERHALGTQFLMDINRHRDAQRTREVRARRKSNG